MLNLAESDGQFEASFPVKGRDFTDAGLVSGKIKNILREKALPENIIRKAAIVIFEAEVNIIAYAEKGVMEYPYFLVGAFPVGYGPAYFEEDPRRGCV